MQKIINVLAVLSFIGTAGIVGGGTYVYLNREAIAENAAKDPENTLAMKVGSKSKIF